MALPSLATAPLRVNHALSVGRASAILSGMILLSRIAGFACTWLISYFFGTGPVANAWNAAYAIPEVMSIAIAGGALATGFVPTFSAYIAKEQYDQARHTFAALLTLLGTFMVLLTLVLTALSYTPLVYHFANGNPILYVKCLRLLLVAQGFFVIGGVFTGTFNSLRHFWMPAWQPVFFNLGVIAFGLFGAFTHRNPDGSVAGNSILWFAYGAIFGTLLGSVLIQAVAARRVGLHLRPVFDVQDEGVQKVLKALLPVFFGLVSGRVLILSLPLMLAPNPSAIQNATRLALVPLELIASGSAIAIFPTISQLAAKGDTEEIRRQLSSVIRSVLKRLGLVTLALIVAAYPLVWAVYNHGQFAKTKGALGLTAQVLMVAALALPALGVQQLLARGFYALGDTKTPTLAGITALAIFGVLAAGFKFLPEPFGGTIGVTLASVVATMVLAAVLWKGLEKRLGKL